MADHIFILFLILVPLLAFLLDLLLADPYSWPHPVKWMGTSISRLEKRLRRGEKKEAASIRRAGRMMVVQEVILWLVLPALVLGLAYFVCRWFGLLVELWFSYQLLAGRCLEKEAMKTFALLKMDDLEAARAQTGMLVGRETAALDETEVILANVETVAENLNDGVTAPLFWEALGGLTLMSAYKVINTMDSMVGYRNERYLDFGRAAALLDDAVNFIPARLAGLLMVAAAWLLPGEDGRGAWTVFRRDRLAHLSPNSAQTESACAGALGIRLGGPHQYFGKVVDKPFIGDGDRVPRPEDIPRACRLLRVSGLFSVILATAVRAGLVLALWHLLG